jgi:glycosyltransferase involved in cell wall biosynthesis
MKISIAMATYCGAKYIQEQVDSFVRQTRLPDELVVCDDGSNDETLDILERFEAETAFEVRIYRNPENLGYAKNFEKAISLCSGDIIFLSDQDDIWFPEKLERVAREFHASPNTMVIINDTRIIEEDLQDTGLTKLKQVRALGLPDTSFITGCCSAFRKILVPLIVPIPSDRFVHDTWLHAIANRLDVRLVIPEALQSYRRHERNASQWLGSSTNKLGPLDLVRAYNMESPRLSCEKRLLRLEALAARMEQVGPGMLEPIGLGKRVHGALQSIEFERDATVARLRVLRMPRLLRWLPALLLYFRGQYRPFSGWKSLARDILRA